MNPDIFAEWFRRQGQDVIQTTSSYWVNQGPRTFQAFPYHWLVEPSQNELYDFLKKYKALALRYSTPLHNPIGHVSYHAILEDHAYDFAHLSKWARKNVRRGLCSCQIEPISFERLANEGFWLQLDTLNRQGRKLDLKHNKWKVLCLTAGDLPGFEAWGALVNGNLAASVISFRMDNCYYMLYQQCLRKYLADNVNNALSFTVTQKLIQRAETKSILYGLHSLDAPPSIDEFKFRMGYIAKPVRQQVVFHPWLKPFVNNTSHTAVHKLLNWNLGNPLLSKAEGMLRFYLDGKQNLAFQHWPECLISQKEEIITSCGSEVASLN